MADQTQLRQFRVGVFADGGARFRAYTVWFDETWKGCCVHVVSAVNGTQAKKLAIEEHRRDHVDAAAQEETP